MHYNIHMYIANTVNVRSTTCHYAKFMFPHSGTAPIINAMATMSITELECGVNYTIIAEGTLNGDLVGPRSSHGTVATNPCPVCSVCPAMSMIYHT